MHRLCLSIIKKNHTGNFISTLHQRGNLKVISLKKRLMFSTMF